MQPHPQKDTFLNYLSLFEVGLKHISPFLHNTAILLFAKPNSDHLRSPSRTERALLEEDQNQENVLSPFQLCGMYCSYTLYRSVTWMIYHDVAILLLVFTA